jgi:hypothetical protein
MFLKFDPNRVWCSIFHSKLVNCILFKIIVQHVRFVKGRGTFGSRERNVTYMWILKKKYDYWWKKYGLEKTDRATKISLFDRNWAISLKPRLVWWALGALSECLSFKCGCSSSSFYWTIKVIKTLVEFVCKCSFFWIVLCHYVQLCTSWQANCVSL